ncbi:MAG: phosphoenolpyruvate--protein phosphotransferase [Sedimenticola sp.]
MPFFNNLFTGGKSGANEENAAPVTLEEKSQVDSVVPETTDSKGSSIQLRSDDILLNQSAGDKTSALRILADQMLRSGYVSMDYTPALLEREAKVSTYLVNGVAIPHGTVEAKDQVVQTGIVVAQFPEGVTWNEKGEVVNLAVGIAANGTEHMEILAQLTNVVMDKTLAIHLGEKANAVEIAEALGQKIELPSSVAEDYEHVADAVIVDKDGMHARPASILSETASKFAGTDIRFRNGDRMANAKSMAEILTMGAIEGDHISVSAQGSDAAAAIEELAALINAGLDTEDDSSNQSNYYPLDTLPPLDEPKARAIYQGSAASPGIAVAPVFVYKQQELHLEQKTSDITGELTLLDDSLVKASEQLESLYQGMKKSADNEAAIFKAQQQLLHDDAILTSTKKIINEGNRAAWSWNQAIKQQVSALESVADDRIKARVADMNDVASRVVCILENKCDDLDFPREGDFILVASELSPSQTACLDSLPVKGICTELGGPNSHMAILARALGIPAIVGVGDKITDQVESGEVAIIDPQSSSFVVSPDDETVIQANKLINDWNQIREIENAQKYKPAVTLDNHEIDVVCNIAKPKEAGSVLENGGEGIGLLRTEFMFEASASEPSVDEQIDALQEIAAAVGTKQLVVRTADIGGDKPVSWLDMPHEENPFLGVRGVRLSFHHESMFRNQLEAIYRVAQWQVDESGATGIHIMFPMISKLSEWHKARDIAEEVRAKVGAPKLPLGIMVEVPSVALLADHFAKEVDFFSVGSNDLTQYTLAMDRMHPDLASDSDSFNPALLNLISMTVKAAEKNGIWVGVCGNMASDPVLASILIGLGVTEISVSPANIPALKLLVRSVSYKYLQEKAQQALAMGSSAEIQQLYVNRGDTS